MASTIFLSFTLPRSSSPFLSIHHRRLHSCITVARRLSTSKTPRPLASLRFLRAVTPPPWSRFNASFASCGGGGGRDGFGGGDGGDHGGGDGPDGGYVKVGDVGGAADDVSAFSPEVIVLDVGGMTCGGCAASVKRILESQPQVSSATVNLATETAIVWPVFEAKVSPDWQGQLGELLANHLTACGFKSNLRDSGRDSFFKVFERKIDEKRKQLKESGRGLAVSWALCAVCLFGHLSHFFGSSASWAHVFHSTRFHLYLSLFTLLGPGRQLIMDGLKSLFRGTPNMNTLVGLGALSSFAVSSFAAFIPKLGWKAFFEEPIMLIAFVLLGRNLEQRAKIKATSDLTGLLSVLPSRARLLVDIGEGTTSIVEVPCSSLSVGDKIMVLPGDRVPADGIVKGGRSTVDESSFTGEPLPVTKQPGVLFSPTYWQLYFYSHFLIKLRSLHNVIAATFDPVVRNWKLHDYTFVTAFIQQQHNVPSASRAPACAGSGRGRMYAALPHQDETQTRDCFRGPPT